MAEFFENWLDGVPVLGSGSGAMDSWVEGAPALDVTGDALWPAKRRMFTTFYSSPALNFDVWLDGVPVLDRGGRQFDSWLDVAPVLS